MTLLRAIITSITIIFLWHIIVILFDLPPYILPGPILVLKSLYSHAGLIASHSIPTILESVIGLMLSIFIGAFWALTLMYFQPMRKLFLPILLISQALPSFAIAPLLVLWLGYGMASKIMTICLMLFFPITSSFYDGLKNTSKNYLDLAITMNATKLQTLLRIRIPSSIPSLGNGLRVAASFAPMGAVIGEWVGASEGLGFLILNANSRMQIDLMFAALLVLIILTLAFYFFIDSLIKHISL
jgi:putative hydroxymethylpyrimidine transport system permease protein